MRKPGWIVPDSIPRNWIKLTLAPTEGQAGRAGAKIPTLSCWHPQIIPQEQGSPQSPPNPSPWSQGKHRKQAEVGKHPGNCLLVETPQPGPGIARIFVPSQRRFFNGISNLLSQANPSIPWNVILVPSSCKTPAHRCSHPCP